MSLKYEPSSDPSTTDSQFGAGLGDQRSGMRGWSLGVRGGALGALIRWLGLGGKGSGKMWIWGCEGGTRVGDWVGAIVGGYQPNIQPETQIFRP